VIVVFYSLVADADGTRERQWIRSVRSLRQHNDQVRIILCLYGDARAQTLAAAGQAGVEVRRLGTFHDAFGDIPGHWRAALSTVPTLHKPLSLRSLAADSFDRLIYLDCDTYLFGDIADLAARYNECDWYAREEYLDAGRLGELSRREGLVPVYPYNTGVVLFTASLVRTLATLSDDFVWYAWRLLLGLCLWRPDLVDDGLVNLVVDRSGAAEHKMALPYPCDNSWVMDEIATCLTLGRVPGLTQGLLDQADVVQGDEYAIRSAQTIVAHYFTSREDRFMAHLGRTG